MSTPNDRPNLADRLFIKLSRPESLAKIIRWAWFISLMMLVLGYIIIYTKVRDLIPV